MSKSNRRKQSSTSSQQHRAVLRREVEVIENEPGYGAAAPWTVRGTLTLYGVMLLVNVPVAAIAMALKGAPNYWTAVFSPDVFLFLIYALVAMPIARRLASQPRSMRPLESVSAGALIYLFYVVAANLVAALIPGGVYLNNAGQVTEVGLGGIAGGTIGAALFPLLYRKLWMPRLRSARRPPQ